MKKIILDKSFLQSESKDSHRLRRLQDAGAVFVLTDTLIYEFGTDSRTAQWPAAQKKLFPFFDTIEVWDHVSDLLKREISEQKPVLDPCNQDLTYRFRDWLSNGKTYVPADLESISAVALKQREGDSVESLRDLCQKFCAIAPDYVKEIQQAPNGEEVITDFLSRPNITKLLIKWTHGSSSKEEFRIKGAEEELGSEWFAYANAKTTAALIGLYIRKYGLANTPGKDFAHTKIDADYVCLLHYADGLATNEVSGSMANICKWSGVEDKVIFSTQDVDTVIGREQTLNLENGVATCDEFWAALRAASRKESNP